MVTDVYGEAISYLMKRQPPLSGRHTDRCSRLLCPQNYSDDSWFGTKPACHNTECILRKRASFKISIAPPNLAAVASFGGLPASINSAMNLGFSTASYNRSRVRVAGTCWNRFRKNRDPAAAAINDSDRPSARDTVPAIFAPAILIIMSSRPPGVSMEASILARVAVLFSIWRPVEMIDLNLSACSAVTTLLSSIVFNSGGRPSFGSSNSRASLLKDSVSPDVAAFMA